MFYTIIRLLSIFILCEFFFIHCNPFEKKEEKNVHFSGILLYLGLLENPGDYYAKIYYFDPLIVAAPLNNNLIHEATASDVTPGKKKLLLIHGWHFDDREGGYPNILQLKDRVLSQNWSNFISSTNADGSTSGDNTYALIVSTKNYDVYAFDYLTSQGVDENGRRLRAKMDALFAGESGTVVIYAHSMGGLVSRFAVYEGTSPPAYLNRVITSGTPFHGSPWASPEFTNSASIPSILGSPVTYFMATTGGQDLRWDNFDSSLSGASNPKLTAINSKTDRDTLFYARYGSYSGSPITPTGEGDATLLAGCAIIHPAFEPSDCIVPLKSASLEGHTLFDVFDLGDLNHIDVKAGTASVRTKLYTDIP